MNASTLRSSLSLIGLAVLFAATVTPSLGQQAKVEPTTQFINEYFANQWKLQKLTPAERTSDEEFIRRASLDIIGRIATADEVRAFVQDKAADKRAKLVDRLLASDEYASNWATVWLYWLVSRNNPTLVYRHQLGLFLEEALANPKTNHKAMVETLIMANGKTNKEMEVNYLLAHLGMPLAKEKQADEGQFDMVPATSRSLRLFLGYRLVAYQLPDHPVHPDFKPEQYWGVNAFFRQAERVGTPPDKLDYVVLELKDNPSFNKKGVISYPDKDGATKTTGAIFLDGRKLTAETKETRRQVLAKYITSHDNFSKAYVNRMWGHFFGRSLHERPLVDDFGSHNKVVHPELLDRLAKNFTTAGHDPRKLIRSLCSSDAYQLKSTTNATNAREETEIYFSRIPLKILTPDQLAESLVVSVSGVAERAKRRAVPQLVQTGEALTARRLGDADWDDLPGQDRIILNVVLLNRKDVNDAVLTSKEGPVARAMQRKDSAKILEELYLTALNRQPTDKEKTQLKMLIDKESVDAKDLTNLWQDLYWALLNSSEFILNH
jgi:hypothetical protein